MKLLPRRHHHTERDAGTPLLECVGLEVAYGRTQILFDVSIDVAEGEVLAVLGTNGAGKSTLLRAITGLTPPKGGKVLLDGQDVTGTSPVKMAGLGVAQMPGGRGIFPDLTVGENLRMATWSFRGDKRRCRRVTDRALDLFPALSSRLSDRAGDRRRQIRHERLAAGAHERANLAHVHHRLENIRNEHVNLLG